MTETQKDAGKSFFQSYTEGIHLTPLIDLSKYPICVYLSNTLLKDCTTGKNIIWGTDSYAEDYPEITAEAEMTYETVSKYGKEVIQPRVLKSLAAQKMRTKKRAEVFTPSWLCNMMNNHCDEVWFGKTGLFNTETEKGWVTNPDPIPFDKRKTKDNPNPKKWTDYIKVSHLEITCGEAPYLVSRYDTTTGELIPIKDRIGILDRKFRVIVEHIKDNTVSGDSKSNWNKNVKEVQRFANKAIEAYQATYGYEYQGDSLLMARINLLLSVVEYIEEYWGTDFIDCCKYQIEEIAKIISWNIWQMDGLTYNIPMTETPCRIIDWATPYKTIEFKSLMKQENNISEKKRTGRLKGERSFL